MSPTKLLLQHHVGQTVGPDPRGRAWSPTAEYRVTCVLVKLRAPPSVVTACVYPFLRSLCHLCHLKLL